MYFLLLFKIFYLIFFFLLLLILHFSLKFRFKLKSSLSIIADLKDASQIKKEREILNEMLEIVEKRNELVTMLDQLRLRYYIFAIYKLLLLIFLI